MPSLTAGERLGPRRVCSYVCMMPQDTLSPEAVARRQTAFFLGQETSHWPAFVDPQRVRTVGGPYNAPDLPQDALDLIPL